MGRRRGNRKQSSKKVPTTAAIYRGPIVNRLDRDQADTEEICVNWTGLLTSTGGGTINTVIAGDPNNSTDYASFTDTYDEARVLGFRIEYFPFNRYSKTTTSCTPLIVVKDRTDNTALSSYSNAMNFSSAKKRSLEDPWSEEIRMNGIEDAGFLDSTSIGWTYVFKTYGDGLTVSTNYGRYFCYVLVQFRGRR